MVSTDIIDPTQEEDTTELNTTEAVIDHTNPLPIWRTQRNAPDPILDENFRNYHNNILQVGKRFYFLRPQFHFFFTSEMDGALPGFQEGLLYSRIHAIYLQHPSELFMTQFLMDKPLMDTSSKFHQLHISEH